MAHWTKEERAQLRLLREIKGYSFKRIARVMKTRSYLAVRWQAKLLGCVKALPKKEVKLPSTHIVWLRKCHLYYAGRDQDRVKSHLFI